jgi:hypothetical protein
MSGIGSLPARPRWAPAFALLGVLYVVLSLASAPMRAGLASANLPPSATPEARLAVRAMLEEGALVRSLFLPVRLFAGWSLFSLALLYACRIWKASPGVRFFRVFGAVVYSETAVFLGAAASLLADAGAGSGGRPGPRWVPGGLDLFIASGDFTVRYALNSVNVFTVSSVIILAVTLAAATGLPRAKAAVSALMAWTAALLVNAAIIHALRSEFHFPL